MLNIFKSLELQNVLVRDINTYGSIVLFNRRLSQEFVRKSLANSFVRVKKHSKKEDINDWYLYENDISYWLGYLLHRDNDLPAIVCLDGCQHWYQHGKRHRDNDKPAVVITDGYQYWYQHDKMHRDNDKPAVVVDDGYRAWYQHDKRHRDNNLPAVIHGDGAKEFWKNGKQYFPEN